MSNFNDFLSALDQSVFEETPVDIDTFLYDKRYMGTYLEGIQLSPIQKDIVDRGSQIYRHETLNELHSYSRAEELWDKTVRNMWLMLGKGSGKDFVARLTVLYIVYKLLCLKDPARYYGKPIGDPIDIINMALNAPQAKTVFFDPLVDAVKRSPWFADKFEEPRAQDIRFNKKITVYSLHSSYEAAEGKNIIAAVLDEIDGFTVEGWAAEVYKAISGTVSSRFPSTGKIITLSFPRSKDGFMMKKYDEVVHEVDVETFTHEYILNESLDRDEPGNLLTVSWTEDTIISYKRDGWYALKAPTFRVNPGRKIEDYKDDFETDRQNNDSDTLMRVCANPPDHTSETFFHNKDKILEAFSAPNGWSDELRVKSVEGAEYYIHVDLSKVSDRTVVAMGHVSDWIEPTTVSRIHTEAQPFITIDLFRVWEPTKLTPVDDAEVMDFIMMLAKKFNVRKVTFDQWNSFDNIQYLESVGIDSEKNSLKREDYLEFRTALSEGRLLGPDDPKVHKELENLVIIKGKVDHPVGKEHFNDISEACCGVIVNCVENTMRDTELQLITLESAQRELRKQSVSGNLDESKPVMPDYLTEFVENMKAI